jgi:hypothetical protein
MTVRYGDARTHTHTHAHIHGAKLLYRLWQASQSSRQFRLMTIYEGEKGKEGKHIIAFLDTYQGQIGVWRMGSKWDLLL